MSPPEEHELASQDESPHRITDLLSDVASGAGGALLGLALGGPPGAVAGSVATPALAALSRLAIEALARRRERAADTLALAATDLHQTPAALADTLLADDHRLDVAVRLLALAAETTYADKRRALARLLRQTATGDDIQVDIAAEFARAWAELDVHHIFLLRTVCTQPPSGEVGWSNEALAQRFPTASLVLVSIVHGLVQRNAIRDIAVGTWDGVAGNERWLVTDFGEQLLGQLEDND